MLVHQPEIYDVIVVGAGLSGLSAARALHDAGKKVPVVEARDRVGGKTRSITTSSGGRLDLGGAWVNEHVMPLISGLVVESGGTLIRQQVVGRASMELGPGWAYTSQSSEGPLSIILDTCDGYLQSDPATNSKGGSGSTPLARQYSLTGFIAGKNAIDIFHDPDSQFPLREDKVLKQLARLFDNSTKVFQPNELIFESWASEEYSQGCLCPVLPTGVLSAYGQYYGQRHGNVWFAGTEYSGVWKGYMEGAVHSGREVADMVLKS